MDQNKNPSEIPELAWLGSTAELLDNRFRFPGTNIRFGVDSLVGLVPYAGDVFTFFVGGFLILVMSRKGASGMLLLKMVGNLWIDGVVGTVPLLGDIFDFRYRANLRNVNLLKEHYEEGKHGGGIGWIIFFILILLIGLVALSVYVIWRVLYWVVT